MTWRVLVLLLLFSMSAYADTVWKARDDSLSIKLPDAFSAPPKSSLDSGAVLHLYDSDRNIEFLASPRNQDRVGLKEFNQTLPVWLKENGGGTIEQTRQVQAGWRPGTLMVISGRYPEEIETVLVYLPLASSSQVLLWNCPASRRKEVVDLAARAVSTLRF